MIQSNLVNALEVLHDELDGELRFDELTRNIYATDASVYQETPIAVAIPKTNADIQRLIQFASEQQIGLIPRTAGTSLAGQVVGAGIVVDVSRHFTEILEINREERWVRVQPGVIRNELNMALAPLGLLFGPETSTANRAMIGGMVGNNSCGSNSIVYGSTRDQLLEVRGFLSDGSEANFGELDDTEFVRKCDPANDSMESDIYRGVRELLSDPDRRNEIRRKFPKPGIHRRNTGYAVDLLMEASPLTPADETSAESAAPFNFCKLIAGSEGTLFFATEIKLRCLPLPPPISGLLCIHCDDVPQALRATQVAMEYRPFGCELIDQIVIDGARRNREQRHNASFIIGEPGAILIVEIRGESRGAVLQITDRITTKLRESQLGNEFPVLFGENAQRVWEMRKAGLGLSATMPGDAKPVAVIEDTAVALADLPQYIADLDLILQEKYGIACMQYAHAGAGEIHLRPVVNLKTDSGNSQFHEIAADIATLVKRYRGSLSGEHGDGRLRAEFLQQMVGEENYLLLREIKKLWDPRNIFNPRKIVEAPPMNEQLRYRPGQATPDIATVFDFTSQQGVLRAAEMCSGSGDCRKTQLSGGTMCPSYMATRDEADTTRARANMLRKILTEPTDKEHPFNNEQLKQVMDLCLSCKGCKSECPSNVDMASLKAEFLQGYYDANGVPVRAQRIAAFSQNMQQASRFPWLYNFLTSNSLISPWVKRIMGFAVKRSLPKLASQTLRSWFGSRESSNPTGAAGKVFLFCDEFTNFNDVEIGMATVRLLERIGFEVTIPKHVESGRSALSKGLLRQARTAAENNVKTLAPLISEDAPLIGIEPSALLSFRDEYPLLVSPELRDSAQRLSQNCLLIDEFIAKLIQQGKLDANLFTTTNKSIRLHGHCHQKALASLTPSIQMLQLPQNYSVEQIPSGCCGMAGSFGYEAEHYDLSMQIGELVLFPTIRQEPDDVLIAAAGTSCRHQITDGTGRRAFHPVEILEQALLD